MSEAVFRPGTRADHGEVVRFQLAMALETEALKLDPEICARGVMAVFDDASRGRYFVCEREGRVIGSLLTTYEWSDWRDGFVWWIHSLYLVPEERGKGRFSAFYRYIKDLALAEGARGLRLYVEKTNEHAQTVYRKIGMSNEHYELFEWLR